MFLRLDGTTFQAQVSGPANGEVLFLLHSLGTNAGIWEEPAQAFSNRYRVIRPDLRGHGMSGVTPGPYSIEGMARDMLGLLDLMGVESAHVAGISIGGMIAQSLAAQAPGRVRSLTLVDTALAIPPAQGWIDRAATVRAEGMEPLVETLVARWVTPASLGEPRTDALRAMLRRTDPDCLLITST
ncbi:alpha/beta fold hydrolase, partial [Roseomonas sp. TAS13]|uniref:alpha/beta fold hydrolase n=1 Tax=Roseomonas sp. TAS13 TaxID=1926319 RepID=UPI000A4B2604